MIMNRTKIIEHYKEFMQLDSMQEDFQIDIDWMEAFIKDHNLVNDNTVLHSVSGCNLPTDEAINTLFENGAHAPFYKDIDEEIGFVGYHFMNGMKAMRNILKAATSL